jgi:HNH endonuclease
VRTVAVVAGEDAASTAGTTRSVEREAGSAADSTLSVGRATRTIPAAIRTALTLRDNGCRFPGCDRPPGWTDGHHIEHWADHGETEVPNLVSLCRRHHHMVHERGWSIRLEPDGRVTVAEPRGRPSLVRRL